MSFSDRMWRLAVGTAVLAMGSASLYAQTTTRASLSESGGQISGATPQARISGNGRYVAFVSPAPNVVSATIIIGSDFGFNQVYRRDLLTGQTAIVSVSNAGVAANGDCFNPRLSDDGRFVSFSSVATNLDGLDVNGFRDVFVRDMQTNSTNVVSLGFDGAQGNASSDSSAIWANASGTSVLVAFRTEATNLISGGSSLSQVLLRNVFAETTTIVSAADGSSTPGNGDSGRSQLSFSSDGTRVGFASNASNLVAGDQNGTVGDVFVRDLNSNATILVSKATNGLQGSSQSYSVSLNSNGNLVAFGSYNGLVNNDPYGSLDVFVRDIAAGTTTRVSVDSKGRAGNGASGGGEGWGLSMSANGRYVAFQSAATNFIANDNNGVQDIFVRDRQSNKTTCISVNTLGKVGNGEGISPTLSNDGTVTCFLSSATNLITNDTNGLMDSFVRR